MFAKRFFYVCAGLLCLALAYHLGAKSAGAQAPGNPVVGITGSSSYIAAVTSNGDVYLSSNDWGDGPWSFRSNIFNSATPAAQPTWGQVKAKYAPPQGKAGPAREDR